MIPYLTRRVAIGLATLLFASIAIFALLEIVPGDPALVMLGINATPEALQALREQMGLDLPAATRYLNWIGGFLTGDFGRSLTYSSSVAQLIAERAAVSLPLALIA